MKSFQLFICLSSDNIDLFRDQAKLGIFLLRQFDATWNH